MKVDLVSSSLQDVCEAIVDCLHKTAPFQDKGFSFAKVNEIGEKKQ